MSGIYCEYTLLIRYNNKCYEYYGYENQNVKYIPFEYGGVIEMNVKIFENVKNRYYKWIMGGRQENIMLYELMDTIKDWKTIIRACEFEGVEGYRDYEAYGGETIEGYNWSFTIRKWCEFSDNGIRYIKHTKKEMEKKIVEWTNYMYDTEYKKYDWLEIINEPNSHLSRENVDIDKPKTIIEHNEIEYIYNSNNIAVC
jgi:hypothetical protein